MKELCKDNTKSKKNIDKLSFLRKVIIIVIALFFVSSLALGKTIAKYVIKEKAQIKENNENKDIGFTVNSVLVVHSEDELFAAINQGYSYVQLDKEIENPLIITQKAGDLENDLILDLNGIEIQRNGYEPILNIGTNTKLTIVDSSEEQTGGLYNPVGSVFNINGGYLSVLTGYFESGPRYSEYYSYNNNILNGDEGSQTKRTIVESDEKEVLYYGKDSTSGKIQKAPIIKSYPTVTGDIKYNHGNLYFDEKVEKGDIKIKADTYCYYQTSEKSTFTSTDKSSADWYYTYYVNDKYEYAGIQQDTANSLIEVRIYGYENAINSASQKTVQSDYYAAIQMSSGTLDVQNGSFYQYFGLSTTACVNSQGGTINVAHGNFSSRVPNATKYGKNEVNVKESDKAAFETNYFNNFIWHDNSSNGLAKKGQSYCILNGGSATVKIGEGKFYSSNNNIVSMEGGKLSINGGTFTKKLPEYSIDNSTIGTQLLAISNETQSSTNNVDTTLAAINMKNGELTIENSTFTINGNNTYGIYSEVNGENNFVVKNTSFNIKGNNCTGIHSSNGTINISCDDNTNNSLKITGTKGKAIDVAGGGSVKSTNYSYEVIGDKSYGIHSISGTITIDNGNIHLSSDDNCYGIYAVSDDKLEINLINSTIAVGCEKNATEFRFNEITKVNSVNASIGVFLSSSDNDSTLSFTNVNIYSYELGIVSNGGTINLTNTENKQGKIITNKASAIAVKNGSVTFDENSNYTITSASTTITSFENSYKLSVPTRNGTTISYDEYPNTDGIYVEGGSFTSKGNLTITHTGLQNKTDYGEMYIYSSLVVTSYAVRVLGGNVIINKGTITAEIGGGIYAGKSNTDSNSITGSITLGNENSKNDDIKVLTKGTKVGSEYNAIGIDEANSVNLSDWKSYKSITGGHAVELDGGSINIYNGTYQAEFGNGIFVNGTSDTNDKIGTITIYDGKFCGFMNIKNATGPSSLTGRSGPAAYYGLKVVGGSNVYIYGGTFDGGNGGAFVTGVTKISNNTIEKNQTARVYIYEGIFGNDNSEDGFNVYDDVEIVFGAYNKENLKDKSKNEISSLIVVNCSNAAIAANPLLQDSSKYKESSIKVYYGTYNGKMYLDNKITNVIYKTYNTNEPFKYTISSNDYKGEQENTDPVYYPETNN